MAEEETNPADQTWRKSLHPLTVADMEEMDDQLREVSLTCLHGTITKQSLLLKKNSCQWALMAQYEEGERIVRHIFTVGKKNGRIVPVWIDYLPTGKWTSKFMSIIEASTKQLTELVTVNPMNGLSYKEHKKRPDAWIKELCKSIDSQLLDSKLWDVESYRDIKDAWDGNKQMIEGKKCKKCQAHRFWIFMAYKQPTTPAKKMTGRICVWTEDGSTDRDFAEARNSKLNVQSIE